MLMVASLHLLTRPFCRTQTRRKPGPGDRIAPALNRARIFNLEELPCHTITR